MNKREIIAGIFIVMLVIISSWLWFSGNGLSNVPDVTFKTIDGHVLSTSQLRGKPYLVTFWATTCPGCIQEMPHLISLYDSMSSRGLEIIAVAMAYDPPNQVVQMAHDKHLPYPIALDIDGSIAKAFDNVMLTPTSFLVAPDGTILTRKIGNLDMDKLRQEIESILDKQTANS